MLAGAAGQSSGLPSRTRLPASGDRHGVSAGCRTDLLPRTDARVCGHDPMLSGTDDADDGHGFGCVAERNGTDGDRRILAADGNGPHGQLFRTADDK